MKIENIEVAPPEKGEVRVKVIANALVSVPQAHRQIVLGAQVLRADIMSRSDHIPIVGRESCTVGSTTVLRDAIVGPVYARGWKVQPEIRRA